MSMVMSVCDPLGFLSGWMLNPRVLMQELWRRQLDWDGTIPDELEIIWKKMAAGIELNRPSSDTQASLSWNGHARRKHSCIL